MRGWRGKGVVGRGDGTSVTCRQREKFTLPLRSTRVVVR